MGNEKDLKLFNEKGVMVYMYYHVEAYSNFNEKGDSRDVYYSKEAYSREFVFNEFGKLLTFKDSTGFSSVSTYNAEGKKLTYKNSGGHSYDHTYDSEGNELTYQDSAGLSRRSIPEFTMEQLCEKIGKFKLIKA